MNVLDELREQMSALVPTLGHMLPESGFGKHVTLGALDVFDVLDAFEAAHPGLEDHTMHCHECGKPMWDNQCRYAEEIGGVLVHCGCKAKDQHA